MSKMRRREAGTAAACAGSAVQGLGLVCHRLSSKGRAEAAKKESGASESSAAPAKDAESKPKSEAKPEPKKKK